MDSRIVNLAEYYRKGLPSKLPVSAIGTLAVHYSRRRESSVLEIAAVAVSVDSLIGNDGHLQWDEITPQQREAFELAFPSTPMASLEGLSSEQLAGFKSGWKGKLFEVAIRDSLNAGEWVGDLHLTAGQHAALAESVTQPGWDLQIINADGSTADEIQLKATESLAYIREALERYPDFHIVATDEVAAKLDHLHVHHSGINDSDLSHKISAPIDGVTESGLLHLLEDLLPLLPFVIIISTEGKALIAGRSSVMEAIGRVKRRAIKTGASMVIGRIAGFIPGVGPVAAPFASVSTRIGADRLTILREAERYVAERTNELVEIKSGWYT